MELSIVCPPFASIAMPSIAGDGVGEVLAASAAASVSVRRVMEPLNSASAFDARALGLRMIRPNHQGCRRRKQGRLFPSKPTCCQTLKILHQPGGCAFLKDYVDAMRVFSTLLPTRERES